MKPILIITGPLRSGTSMIAGMAHRMGWLAGTWFNPPMPPKYRMEWEDQELVRICMNNYASHWTFSGYAEQRQREAELVERLTGVSIPGITIKSPLLALHWEAVHRAIVEGQKAEVIVCQRDPDAIERSMQIYDRLNVVGFNPRPAQERIKRALPEINGTRLHYEAIVRNPELRTFQLAEILGVTDPVTIAAAAETVIR